MPADRGRGRLPQALPTKHAVPREVKSKVRKPDHATAYLMWEVDCAVCWNIDQYREDDLPENCEQCGAPIFVGLG